MTEERRQILEMLAAGKINAGEADRLLGAVQGGSSTATATATLAAAPPRYIRVMIDAKEGKNDKPVHVNVRVPIALLRAGVRLASLVPAVAQDKVNEELRRNGVNFDIREIKPENINEVIDQLRDLTIDVDHEDDDVKIRIFCE
ncbi:MAG TPA: hypothetical protein VGJ79_09680 [Candidatus Dormibacteraeota bacterium]|jgi:hypothetical protein